MRSGSLAVIGLFAVGVSLMGCIIEDFDNGGNGDGEEGVNIVLLDLEAQLSGQDLDVTVSLKAQGQVDRAIEIGIEASKGTEQAWVKKWTVTADVMNKLNDGQTVFETRSGTLPDWGPGEYTIRVVVDRPDEIDEDDETDNELEETVEVESQPPAAPGNLAKTGTLPCSIQWVDNSDNEDGFHIYLGHSCGDLEAVVSWVKSATVDADTTSYSWTQSCCSVAECSWVVVRAYNDSGESEDSNAVRLAPLC